MSGDGAAISPGRWNRSGTRVVYASASLSLALLERLVHAERRILGARLASYRLTIPPSVRVEDLRFDDLPGHWRAVPAPAETRTLGSRWAEARRCAVLRVPSAVVPVEFNYVLNPLHADFKRITVAGPEGFEFDPRLGSQRGTD